MERGGKEVGSPIDSGEEEGVQRGTKLVTPFLIERRLAFMILFFICCVLFAVCCAAAQIKRPRPNSPKSTRRLDLYQKQSAKLVPKTERIHQVGRRSEESRH